MEGRATKYLMVAIILSCLGLKCMAQDAGKYGKDGKSFYLALRHIDRTYESADLMPFMTRHLDRLDFSEEIHFHHTRNTGLGDASWFYPESGDRFSWYSRNGVSIIFDAEAAWQYYLLVNSYHVMPMFWHACKNKCDYLFTSEDCLSLQNGNFIIEEDDKALHELREAIEREPSLLPSVNVTGETIAVTCCYWNNWAGLVRETVYFIYESSRLEEIEVMEEVLYQYDCGIIF